MSNDEEPWQRAAKDYFQLGDTHPSVALRESVLYKSLLDELGNVSGKHILDAGCGDGKFTQNLLSAGASVVGIDQSEYAIELAKTRLSDYKDSVELLKLSLEQVGTISGERFDVVISSMTFMSIPNVEQIFRHFVKLVKPNGRVFITLLHPAFDMNPSQQKALGAFSNTSGKTRLCFDIEHRYLETVSYERTYTFSGTKLPYYFRPVQYYINLFIKNNLSLVAFKEPLASKQIVVKYPRLRHTYYLPRFLILGGKKI